MSKIYYKIEEKLDKLEVMMKLQMHLEKHGDFKKVDMVKDMLSSLSMYRAHMNDEQADYVDGCRYALDEQMEWKVD